MGSLTRSRGMIVAGFAFALFDQMLKAVSYRYFTPKVWLDLIPEFLSFGCSINSGVTLGFFGKDWGGRWLPVAGLSFLGAMLAFGIYRTWFEQMSILFMFLGGASNFLDRFTYGGVVDYLYVGTSGHDFSLIINLGDIAVFMGAAAWIVSQRSWFFFEEASK